MNKTTYLKIRSVIDRSCGIEHDDDLVDIASNLKVPVDDVRKVYNEMSVTW